MQSYQIPDDVMRKVTSALNVALSIALVHAPNVQPQILEAANALDDAINAVPDGEEEDQ